MELEDCGFIVPRQYSLIEINMEEGYLAECIRPCNHLGPHVFKTSSGQLFAWEDDWNCGCCEPDEFERCYIYWEITESEYDILSRQT